MKKLSREEINLCDKIVTRAQSLGLYEDNRVTAFLDVQNATKYFNMKLEEWLNAEDSDFVHDIVGIYKAIDRSKYPADFSNDPLFLPRFAGKEKRKYNYYELEFLIDDDGDGLRRTSSMCVLGYRKPTIEEAKEFWKTDCELYEDETLVAIYELTEDEAHTDFDMSRESEFPIFGEED